MALRTSAPLPLQVLIRFRLDLFSDTRGRLTFILAADLASICGSPRSGAILFSFLGLSDWVPFFKNLIGLLTFSFTLMEENAEILHDGSEPFRVRRYRRQHQEHSLAVSAPLCTVGAAEDSAADSDYVLVQEASEDVGLTAISEALCISEDPLIPAAQSDDHLFDNPNLDVFSGAVLESSALPLQVRVPPSARCLMPHDSHANSSGEDHSAELASTLPFLLCWDHLLWKGRFRQRFRVLYYVMHGRLVRAHHDHVRVVLHCIWTWVFLNPRLFMLCVPKVIPFCGILVLDQFLRAEAIMLLTQVPFHCRRCPNQLLLAI